MVPDKIHQSFSKRLRTLMKEKALSQGDLANLTGVSTATVWGWLNESLPQRRTAHVLCMKLDVSPKWLIEGASERKTFDKGEASDTMLSILEKFEEIESITAKNQAEERVYKKVAEDLRQVASSLEKRKMRAAAKTVRKLAVRYEGFDSSENSRSEISERAQDLIRRYQGARSRK